MKGGVISMYVGIQAIGRHAEKIDQPFQLTFVLEIASLNTYYFIFNFVLSQL